MISQKLNSLIITKKWYLLCIHYWNIIVMKFHSNRISYYLYSLFLKTSFVFLDWARYLPFSYPELHSALPYCAYSYLGMLTCMDFICGFTCSLVSWWIWLKEAGDLAREKSEISIFIFPASSWSCPFSQPKVTALLKLILSDPLLPVAVASPFGLGVITVPSPWVMTTI